MDAGLHSDLSLFRGLEIAARLHAYAHTRRQLRVPQWLRTFLLLVDGKGPHVREVSPGQ